MAVNEQSLWAVIKLWLFELIFYNREDLKKLLFNLGVIVICTIAIVFIWNLGWPYGLTWHIAYILEELIPGPPGPVFVAPIGFLLGLVALFGFDAYKRLQGLLLLVPGVIVMFAMILFLQRLDMPLTIPAVVAAAIAFLFGLLWGGVLEGFAFADNPEMEQGFKRLVVVVGIVGAWGIVEATFDYQSPIVVNSNADIPVSFSTFVFEGVRDSISMSPITLPGSVIGPLGIIALSGLLWTLWDFTKYEMEKDILILGPDRAGKTWLMSGAAFSLQRRAVTDYSFEDPEINSQLQPYAEIFRDRNFDNSLLDANARNEFDFFSFKFEHGVLPRRRLKVRTIDYAGEHLSSIDVDNPWDEFNSKWANDDDKVGVEPNEIPTFERLVYLDEQNEISEDDIPSLLSVMVAEYDAVALTLPADEFATDLQDSDLPAHIERSMLDSRLSARKTDAHNISGTGYYQIYKNLLKTYNGTDFFFTVTMADTFLESYKRDNTIPHLDPKGNPNWEQFRKHVFEKIEEENLRNQVDFMTEALARDHRHYYPVYFEPLDPPEHLTARGEFQPHLDWDDDYYPVRGLKYMLKRMGR